jgi:hypothetical protein
VLARDIRWQLDEVQQLMALHTLVAIGQRHTKGLDHP